jgi:hypothetical protein
MTDASDVFSAAGQAFALVEIVDEPWLYRYAAHSLLDENTTSQSVLCQPGEDPALLVYDKAEPAAWVQGEFQAVGR